MRLSLSGRIIEIEYRSSEMSVPEFLSLARDCGYEAVELRATQLPVGTTAAEVERCRRLADELGLGISCCMPPGLTADETGLQTLEQYADFARILSCEYLKLWIGDAIWLQQACDCVSPYGVKLIDQTHTGGPFETIDSCVETLAAVARQNFGLQYDPANLFEAEELYTETAIQRLGPSIRQLSVQSLRRARPDEADVWEYAGRQYRRCLLNESGALEYVAVFRGLQAIGFDGYVTVNEPRPTLLSTPAFARRMGDDLRAML